MTAVPLLSRALYEEVAELLRQRIFSRELPPGAWIDELKIAEELGISRTPLREALKVLAAEGLVTAVPRRGCQVTELSEDDAQQLFPVMALLEGRCAYEAALRATDAELAELQRLHEDLEVSAAARDVNAYYRANHAFHTRVQALAGNRWLDRVTQELRKFMRMLRGRQLHWPGRLEASIAEHRALIEALVQRDAPRAERLMHDHLMAQLHALQALRAAEAEGAQAAAAPSVPFTSREAR